MAVNNLPKTTLAKEHLDLVLNEVLEALNDMGIELQSDGVLNSPTFTKYTEHVAGLVEGIRVASNKVLGDLRKEAKGQ